MPFKPGNPYRFRPGNKHRYRPGNQHAVEASKPYHFQPGNQMGALARNARRGILRRQLITALNEIDVGDETNLRLVIKKLIELAIGGDLAAIKEIFDRVDGRTTPATSDEAVAPAIVETIFRWQTEAEVAADAQATENNTIDLTPLPPPQSGDGSDIG